MKYEIKYPELHDVSWLEQQATLGLTRKEIATRLGCDVSSVCGAYKRLKVEPFSEKKTRPANFTKQELESCYASGMYDIDIGKRYNIHHKVVAYWRKKWDVVKPAPMSDNIEVLYQEHQSGKSLTEIAIGHQRSKAHTNRMLLNHPDYISNRSDFERQVQNFIESLGLKFIANSKQILPNGMEIDIFIPELNIAIELNGVYWHSYPRVDRVYHLNKQNQAASLGIRLVHIFEHEWITKKEIVLGYLRLLLGKPERIIGARKTNVEEMSATEASRFFKNNHLYNYRGAGIRYGLFYKNTCIAGMTFSKSFFGEKDTFELVRFAPKTGVSVIGAGEKLLKAFVKEHSPETIKSYGDKRLFSSGFYTRLGFILESTTPPAPWFVDKNTYQGRHRLSFTQQKMDKLGWPCEKNFIKRATTYGNVFCYFDCGMNVYVWNSKELRDTV